MKFLLIILIFLIVKYIFIVAEQIKPHERNNVSHEKKIYNFQNSLAGKKLIKNLNVFKESFLEMSVKAEIKRKNFKKKNEEKRQITQFMKILKNDKAMEEFAEQIKQALKEIYHNEISATEEMEELENIKIEVREKINKIGLKANEEKTIQKHAIILDNVMKLFKNLKKTLPRKEYEKIMNNEEILLKEILRPDMLLSRKNFEKFYFGYNETTELKILEFNENSTSSFLETSVNKKSPNFCDVNDQECDRRKHPDSCESRIKPENQNPCGTCWAFAALQNFQLAHCMRSGKDTVYSKQEIIDCMPRDCNAGGNFDIVVRYLMNKKKLADSHSYPYEKTNSMCRNNDKKNVWTGTFTEDAEIIEMTEPSPSKNDQWIKLIKKVIAENGSVVVSLAGHKIQFVKNTPHYLCQDHYEINHAVILTGWKILDGVPVWILRNSWGEWWGENSYGYIAIDSKCYNGMPPIIRLNIPHFGKWLDEKPEYEVIHEQPTENDDEKTITLYLGETKDISCEHEHRLHIRQYFVVRSTGLVGEELECDALDIKNKCEGKLKCSIYYPFHTCNVNFKSLVVKYECLKNAASYDCAAAKSNNPRITDEQCIHFCRRIAPKCVPITLECLHKTVGDAYCNFNNVIKQKEEEKKEEKEEEEKPTTPEDEEEEQDDKKFNCAKATAKTTSTQNRKCVQKCTKSLPNCSSIKCLYTKISEEECKLDAVLQPITINSKNEILGHDCDKAIGIGDPPETQLCIEHCQYYLSECDSLECLYNKIPKEHCDLSKVYITKNI